MEQARITFTLNHLVSELNKNADRLLRQEFGLTYSQFLFLVQLNSSGPVTSSQLARTMGVSRAAVSKRLGWFTSRGLVEVGHTGADNRVVTLRITAHGRELTVQMSDFLEQRFRDRFAGLVGVDLDELNRTLGIVHAHLRGEQNGVAAA